MRALTLFSLLLLGACASSTDLMKEPPKFVFESEGDANTVLACINAHWEESIGYTMAITKELLYKPLRNGGSLSFMAAGIRVSAVIKVVNKSERGSETTLHAPFQFGFNEKHPLVEASATCNEDPSDYSQPPPTPTSDSMSMDEAESKCEALGFEPKTEKYGDCVLKLIEMN